MKGKVNMSIQELDLIARDSSVKVPEGFGDSLRTELDALAFFSGTSSSRPQWLRYAAGIAASLAILAGIGIGLNVRNNPKDTFTDPEQAYAMLQASFSYISSQMDKGVASLTQETEAVLTMTNEIMDKTK
jgi:hypothetical protein